LLAYSYAYLDAILAVLSETELRAVGVGGRDFSYTMTNVDGKCQKASRRRLKNSS